MINSQKSTHRRELLRSVVCLLAGAEFVGISLAAPPASYQVERTIDTIATSSGKTFGSDLSFNAAGDVFFSLRETSVPSAIPAFFFQRGLQGKVSVPAPAGYDAFYPAEMNAAGSVVGKAALGDPFAPGYIETAFLWSLESGTTLPAGMNPSQSYFGGINVAGTAAGASRNSDNVFLPVRWTASGGVSELPPPVGYGYFEVLAINDAGEVLLLAADDFSGLPKQLNLATPAGITPLDIGSLTNRDLNGGNVRMNAGGDIAVLLRDSVSSGVELRFLPAGNRNDLRTTMLPGTATQVFGLKLNALGQAVFAMSGDKVAFVMAAAQNALVFDGYRPQINDAGEMIFGRGTNLMYWDMRNASVQPAVVPVSVATTGAAPEILGFNVKGRAVMSWYPSTGGEQTLAVLQPVAAPTPTPTPSPTPTPVPPVPQPPAPTPAPPAPDPKQERIESLEAQLQVARRIRNPQVRQNRVRHLSITLRRVRAMP